MNSPNSHVSLGLSPSSFEHFLREMSVIANVIQNSRKPQKETQLSTFIISSAWRDLSALWFLEAFPQAAIVWNGQSHSLEGQIM